MMKQSRSRYGKLICLVLLGMLCILAACGKRIGDGGSFGNKDNMPEDTPWNHGVGAIMETEYGWYMTGIGEEMCLRYYDNEQRKSVILCNKPECEHTGGDNCAATYHNLMVVNACLYEGYVYLTGYEGISETIIGSKEQDATEIADKITYGLYRAALDGSSLDKVATVFETDNIQHQSVNPFRRVAGAIDYEHDDGSFIIHKGVAYVPVYIQLGEGSMGLRGAGLYMVDLSTGKVKEIEKYETLQSRTPALLYGVSDYVYYYRFDYGTRKSFWYRYVIPEDRIEAADPMFADTEKDNVIFGKSFADIGTPPVFSADRSYWLVRTFQEKEGGNLAILSVDAKTQKVIEEESFETQIPYSKKDVRNNPLNHCYYSLLLYDGKFLIADPESICALDGEGSLLGEIPLPKEKMHWIKDEKQVRLDFKICNEKVYLIFGNKSGMADFISFGGTQGYYLIFSCPLDAVFTGRSEWVKTYQLAGTMTYAECLKKQSEEYLRQQEAKQNWMTEEDRESYRTYIEQKIQELIQDLDQE